MLTILFGSDTVNRAKRLDVLCAALEKKGTEIATYNDVAFDAETIRGIAGSTSLFGGTIAVVITGVGDIAEKRDALEKIIPTLVESQHQFIVSENTLPAAFIKKVQAKGGVVEEFDLKNKTKKAEVFNVFLLTDAFSEKNRSLTWSLYRQAITLGLEPRELHGKLFWAVKSMLLAKGSKSAGESGLNPFVYGKAKKSASNFIDGHLERIALELATLFHEALISGIDLETALEAFILRALEKRSTPLFSDLVRIK